MTDKEEFLGVGGKELAEEARKEKQQADQEHQEFLDTVAEEEGAEILETSCNLIGEYVVPLKAKMNGELMDRLGRIDARLERLESEDARAYELSDAADDAAQLLADLINDPEYHKELFYDVYEAEGLDALGTFIQTVFESLKEERKRRRGAADGFRQDG